MVNITEGISRKKHDENMTAAGEGVSAVDKVFDSYKYFKDETIRQELLTLAEKKGKDCSLKEYIASEMLSLMEHTVTEYNRLMWGAARSMVLLLDKPINELSRDDMERELALHSKSQQRFCKRWITWARKYSESHLESADYGMHHLPEMTHRKNTSAAWYHAISFQNGFNPGRNIRFGTLLKLWIYEHRDVYKDEYVQGYWFPAYKSFAPLIDEPFRTIRPHHIKECIRFETKSQKNREITVYKMLDKFAYERRLIPQMYSVDMHTEKLFRSAFRDKVVREEHIEELKKHIGEWEVDVVLTMLYTGLTIPEVCAMSTENIENGMLRVYSRTKFFANRRIPIHETVKDSVVACAKRMEDSRARELVYSRKKKGIEAIVKTVTEKYLHESFTPEQLRLTFCSRLLDCAVPSAAVEYLRGTQNQIINGYEATYRHFTEGAMANYIARLS